MTSIFISKSFLAFLGGMGGGGGGVRDFNIEQGDCVLI